MIEHAQVFESLASFSHFANHKNLPSPASDTPNENTVLSQTDTEILDRDPTELAVFHNERRKLISPIQLAEIKVDSKLKVMFYIICDKTKNILSLSEEEKVADKKV